MFMCIFRHILRFAGKKQNKETLLGVADLLLKTQDPKQQNQIYGCVISKRLKVTLWRF